MTQVPRVMQVAVGAIDDSKAWYIIDPGTPEPIILAFKFNESGLRRSRNHAFGASFTPMRNLRRVYERSLQLAQELLLRSGTLQRGSCQCVVPREPIRASIRFGGEVGKRARNEYLSSPAQIRTAVNVEAPYDTRK